MTTEPATIFRCFDGRRYFTMKGAVGHETSVLMRKKYCDCSRHPSGWDEPWYICPFHRDYMDPISHFYRLAQRFTRRRIYCFNKASKP